MNVSTLQCPACGATIKPTLMNIVKCDYCHATLVIKHDGTEVTLDWDAAIEVIDEIEASIRKQVEKGS